MLSCFRAGALSVLATCGILIGVPGVVRAGPVETLTRITFHPAEPMTYVVTYTEAGGGLLITHDGGESFELVCASAMLGKQAVGRGEAALVVTEDGHILHGRFGGLIRGDGNGCGFEAISTFEDRYVTDLVLDPDDASTVYALTSTGGQQNGMYRSQDNGATFTLVGETDTFFLRRVRIAKLAGGQRRFYQSVARSNVSGATAYVIRTSENEGETWTEHPLPAGSYSEFRLLEVDRSNPSRIYAAATDPLADGEVLFVNDAAGAAGEWDDVGSVTELGSFLPAEGGGFWALDRGGSKLLRSDAQGRNLAEVETSRGLSCIAESPLTSDRFACALWELYRTDEQAALVGEPLLELGKVEHFASCSEDVAAACEVQVNAAWCGVTHFPAAPVCLEVPNPIVSPPASSDNGNGGDDEASDGPGMGDGATADDGTEPPGAQDEGDRADGGTGGQPGAPPKGKSGGCQVSAGAPVARGMALGWLSMLALGLLSRRRAHALIERGRYLAVVGICGLFVLTACGSEKGAPADSGERADAGADDASPSLEAPPQGADRYVPGMQKLGEAGRVAVRLVESTPGPPELGDNRWKIVVETPDEQPLKDATITSVQPFMPEHGHASNVEPLITESDEAGSFEIDRINLRMPKLWEVRIAVRSGALEDTVIFKFWIDE